MEEDMDQGDGAQMRTKVAPDHQMMEENQSIFANLPLINAKHMMLKK